MQQINLYQEEFKKPHDPVSAQLFLQVVAAAAGLLLAAVATLELLDWRAAQSRERVQDELAAQTQLSSKLAAELAQRNRQASLAESVEEAEALLSSSRVIREFLSAMQRENLQGYSSHMKDLARASQAGLRLTGFELSEGGASISIRDEALDSATVPRYVMQLKHSTSSLSSKRFSSKIERSEDAQAEEGKADDALYVFALRGVSNE